MGTLASHLGVPPTSPLEVDPEAPVPELATTAWLSQAESPCPDRSRNVGRVWVLM